MSALEQFKSVIMGIYWMMKTTYVPIFDIMVSWWDLYLYGALACLAVFIYFKFVRS